MPELPEVETVCRGLAPHLVGRRFIAVEQRTEKLRIALPERFAERLIGRRVTAVARRAKYILVHLDNGAVMLAHLGMTGRMVIHGDPPPAPARHDHVVFHTDAGDTIIFNDARRFGLITLTTVNQLDSHPLLAELGVDPIDEALSGATLASLLEGKKTPIKAALLDQKVIAGIGNIYASEILFRAGLSPRRSAHTVAGVRAERLAREIPAVLNEAIEAGGTSLRDYVQASGELGYFQHRFAVYDREGKPCPGCDCAGGVRRIVQSNRSTFYCPKRQR
jgi:formamidopyrimidine-DNA glycosylase